MPKWLSAFMAAVAAVVAFLFGQWLTGRKLEKITQQRDTALVTAEQNKVSAQAASQQVAIQKEQQQREDKINAADNNSISTELDSMFDD